MQALVQQAWTPQAHWHIGHLAWQRWHLDGEHAWNTQIWEVDGVPVGWGWIEQPDVLNLAVSTPHANVADDILRWSEDEAEGGTLQTTVLETERDLIGVLEWYGYHPQPDAPYFIRMVHDLENLPIPVLVPRFMARAIAGLGGLAATGAGARSGVVSDPRDHGQFSACHAGSPLSVGPGLGD